MLISANEPAALLKRVFEGLGYPQGQYEDAAAMAGWLPLHGEDGLDALAWQADPALPATELSVPAPGRLVARCHGRSALDALPSLLDLACLRASRQGRIQLEILTAAIARVLKLLADCARKGCWAQARWTTAMRQRIATPPGSKAAPIIRATRRRPAGTRRCGIATLPDADAGYRAPACSRLEADAARIARRVTPADYAQAGRRALEHGTEVSPTLRQRLNRLAEAVLWRTRNSAAARAVDEPVGRGARSLPGSQNRIEQRIPAGMALPLFST